MTLDEKASLIKHESPAISRLSIPAYNWWSEGVHGVARAGLATSFPMSITYASSFDTAAVYGMAAVISTEARAKYTGAWYRSLTFFCPIVDIARDPRWGRILETYGEDPWLTSRIAYAFITGMQGNDPRYMKAATTLKHFAAHAGPEVGRSTFNAVVGIRDMQDTYFPTFRAGIREARAEGVMCAYCRVNGVYACSNKWLLDTIIRRRWGHAGYVVSDCGASSMLNAGVDVGCWTLGDVAARVRNNEYPESVLDTALARNLGTRFKLGLFDPPQMVPYSSIPASVVDCQKHRDYAREMSRKSMVLLRNQNNTLPLSASVKTIAVIGPNADLPTASDQYAVMLGNYYGYPSKIVRPLEGIRARATQAGVTVNYAPGCPRTGTDYSGFAAAETAARNADVVVAVMGLASENQEQDYSGAPWRVFLEGETIDRTDLRLPGVQDSLLRRVAATGKPLILVTINGGPLAIDWASQNAAAILSAGYPGEEGGNAIADVIFGDYNPGGRLPLTYYKASQTFPVIGSMAMTNRTYRYFTGEALYPFGYGLSYTTFTYNNMQVSPASAATNQNVNVSIEVTNSGTRAGDEVVQVYVTDRAASVAVPVRSLAAFKRISLGAGQTATVSFTLQPWNFSIVDAAGKRIVEPGDFTITAGGGQPIVVNGQVPPVKTGSVTLTGSVFEIVP
jgi:beta-glucosidase